MAHSLPTVIALSGGMVVAVALFEVLPEAIELLPEGSRHARRPGRRRVRSRSSCSSACSCCTTATTPSDARAHAQVGALGALGLSAHSFIDGLAVGLAFGVDTAAGVLVLIAVLAHDFADGLNTVSFVLQPIQGPGPGEALAGGGRDRATRSERRSAR